MPGVPSSAAVRGLSGDGQYAVGSSSGSAWRWSPSGGYQTLPSPLGVTAATRANFDGSVIVGFANHPQGGAAAAYWSGGQWTNIDDIAGSLRSSTAYGVNPAGDVIVGYASTTQSGQMAFRWTAATGMVPIGAPDVGSIALGVSGDGASVVGRYSAPGGLRAFYWTQELGMVDLRSHLISLGATGLEGWTLQEVTGISADGRVLVGNAFNPQGLGEGFVAVIPAPASALLLLSIPLITCRRR